MITLDETSLRALLFTGGNGSSLDEKLAKLLGEVLRYGEPVSLAGIGVISIDDAGRLCVSPSPSQRVFLAYVVEDKPRVRAIFDFLKAHGFEPWMDTECLLPGQHWPRAIERAIEGADFVVPCFSKVSTAKRGFFQAELRLALNCARLRPLDATYLVPVRLELRSIQKYTQYVDLFPTPEPGLQKLLQALRGE
ncbi:MAG: toll/interleukin-1 receptor domain-containing protein [Bryobacterales bacterium]|nr:toll/interleukin-1 receptor domain-containing protein [Bryobacterales bacterium]